MYATLVTFKEFVRDDAANTAADALMLLALEASKAAIDRACNRTFDLVGSGPTTRYFTPVCNDGGPYYASRYRIPVDDTFDDAPTVALDSTGNGAYDVTLTAFRMAPLNAAAKGRPFTEALLDFGTVAVRGEYGASVSATWGWTAVPDTIAMASMLQAARFLKRQDAPFGVAGSPEMGNELRLLAKLDPDVAVMVGPYRRGWGAV